MKWLSLIDFAYCVCKGKNSFVNLQNSNQIFLHYKKREFIYRFVVY